MLNKERIHFWNINAPRNVKIMATLVCLASLTATFLGSYFVKKHDNLQIDLYLDEKITSVKTRLETTINRDAALLQRMATNWEENNGIDYQEWQIDAKYLTTNNPNFQAVEWVDPNFRVKWIEPLRGNESAQNLLVTFEETRKKALMNAKNKHQVQISHVIKLVQGSEGFLIYAPIFIKEEFQGFIVGVFRLEPLLNSLLLQPDLQDYYFSVFDKRTNIYLSPEVNYEYYDEWAHTAYINLHNINWELKLWPKYSIIHTLESNLPTIILLVGSILSILLLILIYMLGALQRNSVELEHKSNELELIFRGNALISEAKDFESAMKSCVDLICEMVGFEAGHVYLVDKVTLHRLIPSNIWHIPKDEKTIDFVKATEKTIFLEGEGLPGRVLSTGLPNWIEDIEKDDNFPRAKKCTNMNFKTCVGVPIKIKNKVIAVLEFFTTRTEKENEPLIRILQVLGEQIGVMLEKKNAQRELRESEERNRLILESAGEGIYGVDLEGTTTFVNPAVEQMLGFTASELIGKKMHETIHYNYPNGQPYPREECPIHTSVQKGRLRSEEGEFFWSKGGRCIPIEYTCTPIKKDDHIVGGVITFKDISETLKLKEQLVKSAHYDFLTGLPNRYLLDDTLSKVINRSQRNHSIFALFYLDIDGFKEINDTLGHDAGDTLLKEVGQRLLHNLRSYDFSARIGGDEFILVIQDLNLETDAQIVAEKLIHSLNQPYKLEGETMTVTMSIGISFFPKHARDRRGLLKAADAALYRAKINGKNQFRIYTPGEDSNEA